MAKRLSIFLVSNTQLQRFEVFQYTNSAHIPKPMLIENESAAKEHGSEWETKYLKWTERKLRIVVTVHKYESIAFSLIEWMMIIKSIEDELCTPLGLGFCYLSFSLFLSLSIYLYLYLSIFISLLCTWFFRSTWNSPNSPLFWDG